MAVVRFGRALVDMDRRAVELDGEPRHLEPQAFDLLAYLIAHRDRVVSKEELLDAVWGDQFVSESALTTRVKEIRRALGDDGRRQAVLRNHPGRGYRFVPEIDGARAPTAVSSPVLIGRDEDVAAVAEHLAERRLVTLVGPGGVGKTALAHAVAQRLDERFEGGVLVARLAPVREAADVVHVLRRTTGLTDPDIDDAALGAAIAELDTLLLIDNCEHVLAETTRLLGGIVGAPGGTRVLATSRERLGTSHEQVHPVAPLDDMSARELLLERARAARPGYSFEPDDEPRVDALLQMLDRLPLAIEMAAARLGSIGLGDLADHLTDRLDLLRAPNRDVESRHRTVTELVAWSEDLLDAPTRALLTDLSVFAGAATAEDIAAVVDADVAELSFGPLADLVDHSLVVTEGDEPGRYRLLETVRAAVAPRRNPGVDQRHARHVTDVVRSADQLLRTPDEQAGVARIDGLLEEIRVAHRWARTHDLDLAARLTAGLLHHAHERQWSELAAWSRDAMTETSDHDRTDVAAFAAALAADASNRGDYDEATAFADRALQADDRRVLASAHDTLANVGLYVGDAGMVERHGAALLELGATAGDPSLWVLGMLALVLAPLYRDEIEDARRQFEENRAPGPLSRTGEAWLAYAEGELFAAEGRADEAIESFERAVSVGSSVASSFVVSMARTSGLAVRARAGDVGTALGQFATVLAHHRRTRGMTHGITALRNLVELLVRAEPPEHDEDAMVLLGALSDPRVKSTYGQESELLEGARATVETRHGRAQVESWLAVGAEHDPRWALDRAIELLDRRR